MNGGAVGFLLFYLVGGGEGNPLKKRAWEVGPFSEKNRQFRPMWFNYFVPFTSRIKGSGQNYLEKLLF